MQNVTERVKREVSPASNWIGYLEWLGVEVEVPQSHLMTEREEN